VEQLSSSKERQHCHHQQLQQHESDSSTSTMRAFQQHQQQHMGCDSGTSSSHAVVSTVEAAAPSNGRSGAGPNRPRQHTSWVLGMVTGIEQHAAE
jgi:hypothetical protein